MVANNIKTIWTCRKCGRMSFDEIKGTHYGGQGFYSGACNGKLIKEQWVSLDELRKALCELPFIVSAKVVDKNPSYFAGVKGAQLWLFERFFAPDNSTKNETQEGGLEIIMNGKKFKKVRL